MRTAIWTTASAVLVVTTLTGCGHRAVPPDGFPDTMLIGGATAHYIGTEPFATPVLDGPAALAVYAGTTGNAHACSATPVAHVQSQNATTVTVLVARYAVLLKGHGLACAASAGRIRLTVALAQPFGRRTLLDVGDGNVARTVLDPATVPALGRVPAAYRLTGVMPTDGGAYRTYHGPHADLVLSASSLDVASSIARQHATVSGHPATVGWDQGFEQDIVITWNDGHRRITLNQLSNYDHGHPGLTVAQLLALADTVS